VHSKLAGEGYPQSNWPTFFSKLEAKAKELGIKEVAQSDEPEMALE